MTAARGTFVYCGPAGCVIVPGVIMDYGSDRSVVADSLAKRLGLVYGAPQVVDTGGGPVVWPRSRARIGMPNSSVMDVGVWIDTADGPTTIGADALRSLGFRIVPPNQANADDANAEGAIPEAAYETVPATGGSYAATGDVDGTTLSRRAVCASCSYKATGLLGVEVCSICKCPLLSKTALSGPGGCPMGKW